MRDCEVAVRGGSRPAECATLRSLAESEAEVEALARSVDLHGYALEQTLVQGKLVQGERGETVSCDPLLLAFGRGRCPWLVRLYLCFVDVDVSALALAVRGALRLSEVRLDQCRLEYAEAETPLELQAALSSSAVDTIEVFGGARSGRVSRNLIRAILGARVSRVEFSEAPPGTVALAGEALALNPALRDVRIDATVTLEDAQALRRGLEANATLECLVLDRAKVESRDAVLEISAGIESAARRSLRELGFTSFNGLGHVGGPKLAWDSEWGALVAQLLSRRDCRLERCDLRRNRMGPEAGRLIREALFANTTLVDLRYSGNAFKEEDSRAIHNLVLLSRFVTGWVARGAALPDWVREAIPDQAELLFMAFAGEVEGVTSSLTPQPPPQQQQSQYQSTAAHPFVTAGNALPGQLAVQGDVAEQHEESDSEAGRHESDESDESAEDEAEDSKLVCQAPRPGFLRDAQLKLRVTLAARRASDERQP